MQYLASLKGYRTYATAVALGVVAGLKAAGLISAEQAATLTTVGAALAAAFIRAAIPDEAPTPSA